MRYALVISLALGLALALVSGCDPVFRATVRVESPAGPVRDAIVSMHCGFQGSIVAAVTDEHGTAELGGLGDPDPSECWFSVAQVGYTFRRVDWGKTCKSRVCNTPVRIEVNPASKPAPADTIEESP